MITVLSSMAVRRTLADLAERYRQDRGIEVSVLSIGGVEAARRLRAGETFDLVFLPADVLATHEAEGAILAGSRHDFVRSAMALAVRAGAPKPKIGDEADIKAVFSGAGVIGYSTGPSGNHLVSVLKPWGLDPALNPDRFVQAKPGVPVASLVANGEADIGVQQLSELLGEPGIEIVGLLPPPVQTITTFSVGIGAGSQQVAAARDLLDYLLAPTAEASKRRFGLEPID